jgi:hypothetical protein
MAEYDEERGEDFYRHDKSLSIRMDAKPEKSSQL